MFAKLFLHRHNARGNSDLRRMKHAVWIDLINMLLWFVAAAVGAVAFVTGGKRSLHTGRAAV